MTTNRWLQNKSFVFFFKWATCKDVYYLLAKSEIVKKNFVTALKKY